MDTLQKGRYRKVFGVVEIIAFLNALICSALHILGIADYIETLPVAHVILAGSVLIGFITMVCDLKRGYVSEKYTFFSIILAMIAIIAESSLVYFRVSASGIFIGIGMIILLCTNLLKRNQAKKMFEIISKKENLEFLGWREVPILMRKL